MGGGEGNWPPVHGVTISQGFWMGKYTVTQLQWQAVMGSNPSKTRGGDLPVEMVSWDDCQQFIARLNGLGQWTFRLPTEAEWEYAWRAGTTGETYGSVDAIAWYKDNSGGRTHPVGQKQPNAFGLYDMNGNVVQWCQDWYDKQYYSNSPTHDPQGPDNGKFRAVRGSPFGTNAKYVRSTIRGLSPPGTRLPSIGFRVVAVARTQ